MSRGYVPALGFHWLTPAYDVVVRLTTRERAFKAALIEQAGIASGHTVLDLACGTGTLAIRAKKREPGATVTGLDGDPHVLERAARKARDAGADIAFDQALATALPYADRRFDRALSSLFFHHLSWADKRRAAAELYRVIKPGGELHVADWGRARGPLMRAAFVPVQLLDGFANTGDNVAGRLVALFADAGFVQVAETRVFPTMLGTLSLYKAVRPEVAP